MAASGAAAASASASADDAAAPEPATAAGGPESGPADPDSAIVMPAAGVGGLPTAASKSLRAQVAEHEMIRCAVTGERVHFSKYSNYQHKRYDNENRRSREGTEIAHKELAAMHRRYFNTHGITHTDAWSAIRDHNFSFVYGALRSGFPVNQRDKMSGRTMLHEAASVGEAEICELLLEWPGCNPDARCLVGRDAPIHFAAVGGNWRVVDMLCRYGADPRDLDKYTMTPLHMVTTTEAAQHLLRHGADERPRDRFGRTAAMCADERGDTAVAELLREVSLRRMKGEHQREQQKQVLKKQAGLAKAQRLALAAARDEVLAKERRLNELKEDYASWRKPDGKAKARAAARRKAKASVDDDDHKALLAKYDKIAREAGRDRTLKMIGGGSS